MISKDLLYSTGNSIQYFVTIYRRTESEEGKYLYLYLNYCTLHLKWTRYCKSTIFQLLKNEYKIPHCTRYLPVSLFSFCLKPHSRWRFELHPRPHILLSPPTHSLYPSPHPDLNSSLHHLSARLLQQSPCRSSFFSLLLYCWHNCNII